MNRLFTILFIPLILSLGITPVLQSDFLPDAEAIKSKGTSISVIGSDKVCGDKLCSEIGQDKPSSPDGQIIKPESDDPDDQLSLLFIQTANSGTFIQKDGRNILTLVEISEQTVWFSDRPQRATGSMATDLFSALWIEGDDSFADDPPNAALEITDSFGNSIVVIVELTNPVFSPESETLQYDLILLGKATEGLSHYDKINIMGIPDTFSYTTLFIDNFFTDAISIAQKTTTKAETAAEAAAANTAAKAETAAEAAAANTAAKAETAAEAAANTAAKAETAAEAAAQTEAGNIAEQTAAETKAAAETVVETAEESSPEYVAGATLESTNTQGEKLADELIGKKNVKNLQELIKDYNSLKTQISATAEAQFIQEVIDGKGTYPDAEVTIGYCTGDSAWLGFNHDALLLLSWDNFNSDAVEKKAIKTVGKLMIKEFIPLAKAGLIDALGGEALLGIKAGVEEDNPVGPILTVYVAGNYVALVEIDIHNEHQGAFVNLGQPFTKPVATAFPRACVFESDTPTTLTTINLNDLDDFKAKTESDVMKNLQDAKQLAQEKLKKPSE